MAEPHKSYRAIAFPVSKPNRNKVNFRMSISRIANTIISNDNNLQNHPASDNDTLSKGSISKMFNIIKSRKLTSDECKSSIYNDFMVLKEIETSDSQVGFKNKEHDHPLEFNERPENNEKSSKTKISTAQKMAMLPEDKTNNESDITSEHNGFKQDQNNTDVLKENSNNADACEKTSEEKMNGSKNENTDDKNINNGTNNPVPVKNSPKTAENKQITISESAWFYRQYKWEVMFEPLEKQDDDYEALDSTIKALYQQARSRKKKQKYEDLYFPSVLDPNADLQPSFVFYPPKNWARDTDRKLEMFEHFFKSIEIDTGIFKGIIDSTRKWLKKYIKPFQKQRAKIHDSNLLKSLKSKKEYFDKLQAESNFGAGCIKYYEPIWPTRDIEVEKTEMKTRIQLRSDADGAEIKKRSDANSDSGDRICYHGEKIGTVSRLGDDKRLVKGKGICIKYKKSNVNSDLAGLKLNMFSIYDSKLHKKSDK